MPGNQNQKPCSRLFDQFLCTVQLIFPLNKKSLSAKFLKIYIVCQVFHSMDLIPKHICYVILHIFPKQVQNNINRTFFTRSKDVVLKPVIWSVFDLSVGWLVNTTGNITNLILKFWNWFLNGKNVIGRRMLSLWFCAFPITSEQIAYFPFIHLYVICQDYEYVELYIHCIEPIVLLDFIHRLVSQKKQTKLMN